MRYVATFTVAGHHQQAPSPPLLLHKRLAWLWLDPTQRPILGLNALSDPGGCGMGWFFPNLFSLSFRFHNFNSIHPKMPRNICATTSFKPVMMVGTFGVQFSFTGTVAKKFWEHPCPQKTCRQPGLMPWILLGNLFLRGKAHALWDAQFVDSHFSLAIISSLLNMTKK